MACFRCSRAAPGWCPPLGDDIIERAEGVEPWHEPIVNPPTLSQRAIRRVAGFVASSLLNILQDRSYLDQQTARELKKSCRATT